MTATQRKGWLQTRRANMAANKKIVGCKKLKEERQNRRAKEKEKTKGWKPKKNESKKGVLGLPR